MMAVMRLGPPGQTGETMNELVYRVAVMAVVFGLGACEIAAGQVKKLIIVFYCLEPVPMVAFTP